MIPSFGDFPGGPVTETLPSSAGDTGSIPGQGVKIPHASLPKKKQNINNIVLNSMKTLKMAHIKKVLKKNDTVLWNFALQLYVHPS